MKLSASSKLHEYLTYGPISELLLQARKKVPPKLLSDHDYEQTQNSAHLLADPDCWMGIEIEVEKIKHDNLKCSLYPGNNFWHAKTDNSLKDNGREFVSVPIRGAPLVLALNSLHTWLNKENEGHVFSPRCGLHLHVGCRYMTLEQIIRFLLLYLVTENIFFDQAGNKRNENNFCVPLGDSIPALKLPEIFWALEHKAYDDVLAKLTVGWKKYAAFNLRPLEELGTIEFRHYLGTSDPVFILKQINLIQRLRRYAIRVSTETLTRQIGMLNTMSTYSSFIEDVLGITDYYNPEHLKVLMEDRVLQAKSVMSFVPFVKTYGSNYKESPLIKAFGVKVYTREEYETISLEYTELIRKAHNSSQEVSSTVAERLFRASGLPTARQALPKEFTLS